VDDEPPPISQVDPRPLLYHARDSLADTVDDSAATRRIGWRRVLQFGLYFYPSSIDVRLGSIGADLAAQPAPMKELADTEGALPFSVRPWAWARDDRPSVEALRGGLLCAPILQAIIFNRFPDEVRQWADEVSRWPFKRIVPCHLANNVAAGPREFRQAFAFLDETALPTSGRPRLLAADYALLTKASEILTSLGVIGPPKAGSLASGEPD